MASCKQINKETSRSLGALCVLSKTLLTFTLSTATLGSKEGRYHIVLLTCSGPDHKMFTISILFFIFRILILKELGKNLLQSHLFLFQFLRTTSSAPRNPLVSPKIYPNPKVRLPQDPMSVALLFLFYPCYQQA